MKRYCVMIAALLAGLSFVPLTQSFGINLEYEYATFLGWLVLVALPLVAMIVPLSSIQTLFSPQLPALPGRWRYARILTSAMMGLVVLPLCLFVAGLGGFASGQCKCSGSGYVFWMLIQVLPAYYLGMSFFVLILRSRHMRSSRAISLKVTGVVVVLAILALGGLLWFFPQKRLVSVFLGFLHGPIYDEWIPVDHGVVLSRLAIVIFAIGLIFLSRRQIYRVAFFVSLVVWCSSWFYDSGSHGLKALIHKLPDEQQVEFLKIHWRKADKEYETRMRVFMEEAAFHAKDLVRLLDIKNPRTVHVFVYPDRQSKKLWFGGGSTDVTDVWTPSIHVTADSAPHQTLRHELVHAIASQFGWNGLGFHPNMAITEGLAMALAPGGSTRSLHEMSAVLLHDGKIKDPFALFSPAGFWSESGARAYTVAGSFLLYLLEHTGAQAVRDLYAGDSSLRATGKTLMDWGKEWQASIVTQYDPRWSLQSESFFRDPGVLRSTCPHTKADYAQGRSDSIYTRLRQPLGWDVSRYLDWRHEFDPKDRSSLLDLWHRKIREDMSPAKVSPLGVETWLSAVRGVTLNPAKTLEDIELKILESDLLVALGQHEQSLELLHSLQKSFLEKKPGESMERQVEARILVETSGLPAPKIYEWRRYLAGWRGLPEADANETWIFQYLRLRREKGISRSKAISHALFPVEEMTPLFSKEYHRVLAERFLNVEDYSDAALYYERLAKDLPSHQRDYYLKLRDLSETASKKITDLSPM